MSGVADKARDSIAEWGQTRALLELGGWKSEHMVMRYTHVNPDHLVAAVNALPWDKSGKRAKR